MLSGNVRKKHKLYPRRKSGYKIEIKRGRVWEPSGVFLQAPAVCVREAIGFVSDTSTTPI